MNLQIIKFVDGKDEYVLLSINIYHSLRSQIKERITKNNTGYIEFNPANYVDDRPQSTLLFGLITFLATFSCLAEAHPA